MNKEEILYNEIYERTKDFGRTHFIKEIMRLQREYQQLKEINEEHKKLNGELREENKKYKEVIDKAIKELINIPINASYSEIEEYSRKAYRALKEVAK